MTRKFLFIALAAFATAPGSVIAQTPMPVGDPFQVNSYTTSFQLLPRVAASPAGDFVVVWESFGSAGSDAAGKSVQGQRYASDGTPQGAQFQVNSYTSSSQDDAAVTMAADGGFVVAWSSYGSGGGDSSKFSVQAQRYASGGTPQGAQFQVNAYTPQNQLEPSLAIDPEGDFVVVWRSSASDNGDTSANSVQGQRYASDGTPLAGQFLVNSYTTGDQRDARVVTTADGGFIVVWRSDGSDDGDTSEFSVQGQRFGSDGSAVGGQFQTNSYTTMRQEVPSVAADPNGGFVVTWQSEGSLGDDTMLTSIQARRFASNGDPLGLEFQVNSYTTGFQYSPAVGFHPDGDFVVVWSSEGSPGSDTMGLSIQGQRFASNGDPRGDQFQVNSTTTDDQLLPSVAVTSNDDFVVVWTSSVSPGDDTSSSSIQGQRFRVPGQVGDRVWFDADGNGVQDGGEPGVPDVAVSLHDGVDGELLQQTTTDSEGRYAFDSLAGEVYLHFDLPDDRAFTPRDTSPDDVDSDVNASGFTPVFALKPDTVDDRWDAGLVETAVQIGDRVWIDANGNGIQSGGEVGATGVEVRLYREPDPPFPTKSGAYEQVEFSDADGYYSFTTEPGTFYLEFLCPSDAFAALDQGASDELDSDVEPTTGTTSPFTLGPGASDGSRDAGILDTDDDGVVCSDNCPDASNADQADGDGDGSGDACDLCLGDDASGDADGDGLCASSPSECDDSDPTNACAVFADGFESGDTTLWSSTVP